MEIDIETYKGFKITFDTGDALFMSERNSYANPDMQVLQSTNLKTLRTKINKFITDNVGFGEFKVRKKLNHNRAEASIGYYTVLGVTANGRLRLRNAKTEEASTISRRDLNNYEIYFEEDDKILQKVVKANRKIYEKYRESIAESEKDLLNLNHIPLIDYMEENNIELKR